MSEYPKRGKVFVADFHRQLRIQRVATKLGRDVYTLLSVIAELEDEVRYQPVDFWNSQLMEYCGILTTRSLRNIRKKATESGWLHYEQGDRRRPGFYWVTIPRGAVTTPLGHFKTCRDDTSNDTPTDTSTDTPSLPIPKPNPKGVFTRPTVKQIQDYVGQYAKDQTARGKRWPVREFDADAFNDHYTSNGWKQSRGNVIKDWRATVRNWGRRDFSNTNGQPEPPASPTVDAKLLESKIRKHRENQKRGAK